MNASILLLPSQKKMLTTLLGDHSCLDEKESKDRDEILSFIHAHDDAHLRANKKGHLTGSALVLDRDNRVLLTHHRKLNRWLQLGGHGEGEWDPAEVAMREASEESGLSEIRFSELCPMHSSLGMRRPFDLDVHEIPARDSEPAHLHLDIRYVMETSESPDAILKTDESHSLKWFTLEDALTLDPDNSLRRALTSLRLKLLGPDTA